MSDLRRDRKFDRGHVGAGVAGEKPLLEHECSEWAWGWPGTRTSDICAAARLARRARVLTLADRLKLGLRFPRTVLHFEKLRLRLFVFTLQLRVCCLVLGQLGLEQRKVLAKHCRRAVFGYQALERIEQIAKKTHRELLS